MNTAPATIIRIGNHRRGSVHTTHVQLALRGELRITACGRELSALDWRLVGPTESSSQHLPCQPCIRAELDDDDQCESCGALDGEPCECIEAADAIDAGGIDVDWPVTMLLDDDAWTVGAPNWRPATGRPELGVARRAFPGSERRCDRCRTGGEHAYYVAAHDGRRYSDARSLCEPCSLELLAPPTDTVPQTVHVDLLDTSAVPDAALAQTAFTLELATPLRSGQLELL